MEGFVGEKWERWYYMQHGATGSGEGPDARAPISTADMLAIPAGTVVEQVYVIIETAVTGSTAINLGDDDDNDGYVPTASLTLGTPGVYGYGADQKGAYLGSAGAARAKYYSAAGKEAKVAVTGASTAGKLAIYMCGSRPGVSST
jgi:hypothetical protein